ncbi:MAG TPA: hypothetical protein VJX70_02235 [Candidatus Acidoferrum sp.]|nr:hypothetical protein [Candidatus Acidoferrum sp.]
MAKKFKVGYKTVNAKLKVTRHHLSKIMKHVSAKDKKEISVQIKAIDVIIAACGRSNPTMSKSYVAK